MAKIWRGETWRGLSVALLVSGCVAFSAVEVAAEDHTCGGEARDGIRGIEVLCLNQSSQNIAQLPDPSPPHHEAQADLSEFEQDFEGLAVLAYIGEHDVLARAQSDPPNLSIAAEESAGSSGESDSSEDPGRPGEEAVAGYGYKVGAGDTLDIQVWRQSDLSTSVTVRPDGRISVPLIEDLYVEGLTPSEIARELESQLSRFIQDPLVTISASGFTGPLSEQIRVVGQAVTPSAVPYQDGLTVLDVMIAVGGLSRFADGNGALIVRRSGDTVRQIEARLEDLIEDGDSSANVDMAPGDIVIIPEGFFSGDWRIEQFGSIDQEITDNIDRNPRGQEEAALVTEIGPAFSINVKTARVTAALRSLTQGRYEIRNDSGVELRNQLNATSTVEFYEDMIFLDASVASSRQTIDTTSGGGDQDQEQVTSITISPYLRNHFGSFADSELRLNLAETLTSSDDASDDSTTSASFTLNSGRDFSNLIWSIVANTSRTARSEAEDDLTESSIALNTEYGVSRHFSLIGSVGYQIREDSGTEDDVDDPTWEIGFNWRPSPRTDVRMTYGQRDGDESFRANISHEISPRSAFLLSYSEELETSQERLQSDLAAISIDTETGELTDSRTDGEFDPNTSPFSIEDETTRTRRLSARLSHQKDRDNFLLTFQGEEERTGGSANERSLEGAATWVRRLHPKATFSLSGSLERSELIDSDRTDHDVEVDTSLSYRIYSDVEGRLSYTYARRFSKEQVNEFVENLIQVGASIQF